MKFTVNKHKLSDAITKLSRAVSQRSSTPVLEGILFSAEKGLLTMAAYNYEIGMKKEIEIECEEEGDVVLGAKLLGEIIRKMPNENITITVDEKLVCHIECGASNFDIIGIEAEDFPEIPGTAGGNKLTMLGSVLKAMVRQTVFAVKEENEMPMYTGIYFEVEKDYIKLVALDGMRIAIRKVTAKNENPMNFVVTGKSISEVFRMIEDENEVIEMCVGKNHMSFQIGGYYLVSRLIEGTYLDYKSVIRKDAKTKIYINTEEITESIERISLIINNVITTPVKCSIKGDEMQFSCATAMGRANDVCPIKAEGENIDFGFNARFMLDALKATESEDAIMIFNGDIAPIMIKPIEGDDFIYIVMPMRIKNA